jgi:hypothetical protein
MKLIKALTLSLGDLEAPVITHYQLGLLLQRLYEQRKYQGEQLNIQKDNPDRRDLNHYLSQLLREGILSERRELPKNVYSLLGSAKWEPEGVVCTIDPFCYVSHLSAMAYHGLTDRIPSKLFISSPGPKDWKQFAMARMEKNLGSSFDTYIQNGMPVLQRIAFDKIGRMEIHRASSKHLGAYRNVRGGPVRVATIGRTFLEMLRNPELCGGINHVLEVYAEHAEKYFQLITSEIDANGKDIDKVRAGYILEERLSLSDAVVEGWKKFVQRGGSRKLDSSAEYIPKWSSKWCISINTME